MAQPFQATASQIDLQTPPLALLLSLPLESRFAALLQSGRGDLTATLRCLRGEGAPLPAGLDAERLAWAVAFNVEGPSADPRKRARGYADRWPLDAPWIRIWSTLALSELALSVACEQRQDWQNPGSRPIEIAEVNRAFEFVYARDCSKVIGDIYGSFGNRAGSPESIAQEAWSRVFCDYWSSAAHRRFLGTSRISTLVCQVARYVACDALRDGEAKAGPEIESLAEVLGVDINPLGKIMADELRRHVRECARQLPPKQQVVAAMVWFRGVPAKRAAEVLRVSEPAVSQLLKKAIKALRICLSCQGYPCGEGSSEEL